jgi:NAD(P)-dependent dehydrogenase (short-subunit alcohol dehydrogenase family)
MRTWFVTGASRGFGLAIARHALEQGDRVAATARRPEAVTAALGDTAGLDADRLLPLALDVTDDARAGVVVDEVVERWGGIDVLVNNAGYGLVGAVEETSPAEIEDVFATNVFGLLNVTRRVLPGMRARRTGRVINISSVGGFAQVPGWGVYGATKFAVEGLSEAMRGELAPLGIAVVIVEPGSFRTDFLDSDSLHRVATVIEDYAGTAGAVRTFADEHRGNQLSDPAKGAAAVYAVATADDPPLRLQLGPDAFEAVTAKLEAVAAEQDRWRELATSTTFD